MSKDEGSCLKNEKNDMLFCSFIGMWDRNSIIRISLLVDFGEGVMKKLMVEFNNSSMCLGAP